MMTLIQIVMHMNCMLVMQLNLKVWIWANPIPMYETIKWTVRNNSDIWQEKKHNLQNIQHILKLDH
jgi:hypothetical protein